MFTSVRAVYENGVLRPDRPLPFAEGTAIDVLASPAPPEDDALRRMRSAKSLEELFAIWESLPPEQDDGYDPCRALNENRRLEGRPPVYPDLDAEGRP